MPKIALTMIVKGTGDEPFKLRQALKSASGYVDGVFITLTGPKDELAEIEAVCQEFGAHVSYCQPFWEATQEAVTWLEQFMGCDSYTKVGDKIFLFDEARNFNMAQVPEEYEWILWMDCDDVLLRAENLRVLAEDGLQNNIEAYYFNYLYQVEFDANNAIKNILIQHLRERMIRNTGVYKWVAPIHETLIEQRPTNKVDTPACEVLHTASHNDRQASLRRNLKSLELAIYQTEGKDPRQIYYLAKALFDLYTEEDNHKAARLIFEYLLGEHQSGWPEERAQAWEYLAEIYRRQAEHNNSIKACMNALIEDPQNPSTYVNLALSYMHKQEWERALFWVKLASAVPHKKTTLVTNPKDIQARTLEIIYNCCLNMHQVDEAWAAMVKLTEFFPDDQQVAQAFQAITMLRQERDLTKNIVGLANYLRNTGESPKIKALLAAAPDLVKGNPFLVKMYQENNPPRAWGEKEITIYCGQGFTNWSPRALENPGNAFVGGSEEAVIYVAEALQRQGWKVTVYGDPGQDESEIKGVQWLPYYKFNRMDNFNILIAWRDIRFFDTDFKAKKKYLWCHDIQNPLEFTQERVDRINKVFFLSEWHRQNVPDLADSKVLLTTNGIVV